MKYPVESNELQDFYRTHIGEEPNGKTNNLLCALTAVLNQVYIEGVEDGKSKVKNE